ncbi:MAG TPA: imidazoleglycerol-phosphate dehydratase HisB [Candidatus Caldiarchaeum subterraneum]|uniref:Imidazoleglycerol-phosphate dehydratase n=1 Tax=Caldiarchaeum subterraneum TaxID=311458 RepID=A0A833EAR7_CALS0|nr:imidazoleglycerol-phosphate dehydratase HisB [Candidatus Caldarchaeum subterraneum]
MRSRLAKIKRETAETHVEAEVNLDGSGRYSIETRYKFMNHMIETLSKHSLIDIYLKAEGDLRHHIIEDCGITLGKALNEALGDRRGIRRFGYALIPMDESLALAAVDLVKRPKVIVSLNTKLQTIEDIPVSEIIHFIESLGTAMEACIHVKTLDGFDEHHKVEACFKALAIALRNAVERDERRLDIASTKGVL